MHKNFAAFIAFALAVLCISCSKSSTTEETPKPPTETNTTFTVSVGGTTYNLDSLHVTQVSSGYYIRAMQKGNSNASHGVSLFINAKTSQSNIGFGNMAETGKAYVSGSLGAGQNFSSGYTNPTTGGVTNSNGGINLSVTNGVLTASFTGPLYTATGETIPVSLNVKTPSPTEAADNPNNQFFTFEFNGATYNLTALAATPYDKGYFIMGIASNNQIVNLVINTKESNVSVPFGDMYDAGKSVAVFNIPSDQVFSTTGRDCHGREIVYNQGQAKLTSIGNVGSYIEGHISGSAFKNENACNGDGKTIENKSFKGFFKIRRII